MMEFENLIKESYDEWMKKQGGKKRVHPSYPVFRAIFLHVFPTAASIYGVCAARQQQVNIPVESEAEQVVTVTTNKEESNG